MDSGNGEDGAAAPKKSKAKPRGNPAAPTINSPESSPGVPVGNLAIKEESPSEVAPKAVDLEGASAPQSVQDPKAFPCPHPGCPKSFPSQRGLNLHSHRHKFEVELEPVEEQEGTSEAAPILVRKEPVPEPEKVVEEEPAIPEEQREEIMIGQFPCTLPGCSSKPFNKRSNLMRHCRTQHGVKVQQAQKNVFVEKAPGPVPEQVTQSGQDPQADTPSTSNPPKAQIELQPIYLPPRKEQPEPKRGPWYPWTTPEPIRYNLLPPAGPGSLWDLEGCVARDNRKPVVARKQKPVDPVLFARLRHQEEQRNVFTPYYGEKKDGFKCQKCPKNYRFSDCISFAAMSHTWTSNWDKDLPVLPRANCLVIPLPDGYPDEDTVFAYYRVLVEKENKYILIACHVNLHGYHRGDLRFLEVNTRTELEGFPGTNVIGNLFPGDIVAVTELARNSEARFMKLEEKVSEVSQESTCYWMVSRMQLFPRSQTRPVTFTFLNNRMAVVKGDDEPMRVTVEEWKSVATDKIFIGVCFKPEKLEYNFTEDYGKNKKNMVTSKVARISSYPNAFGTIYGYKECTDQNEHFDVGINAFSTPDLTIEQRNKVVETCSLMGFSAANTISNGRFDCRAFRMMDISKSNLTIKFRIDNPPAQPSLGLWNSGNRIVIGGPEGDVNASIKTVIQETEDSLRITARLSTDIPKHLDFRHGEYIVSQREITDHYFLYDGYFQDLEQGSNGRKIIETLYGGPPLELITDPRGFHQQYYFPNVPEMLALNQYQNEYVQMLLDGNPLIIGSSPFGCGKSMTIITAALEIYKRNCEIDELVNQRQQLLITQSNYASVNLIEIAKRICSSGDMSLTNLKFVRFVTEENWNELPDNCRTEYDMPYIMDRIFCEWGSGRIDENDRRLRRLQKCHFNHMLAYILKNHLLEPHELGGGGRKTYDRLGEFKTPFSLVITEAFFLLYQPDLIMTTADSSKNLLGVLKEVCTVQIDEASQLPEYILLGLLKTFNRANFGLIGDIHQLPPYCEETLSGKMKEFGIGNTMERAITGKLFPTSTLRYVYRCHPKTTRMLSQLFYGSNLLSGVQENQRNQFMLRRSDFWVNPDFPFMIVNNDGASYKMGTSVGNDSEKEFIGKMITNLLHHPKYPVKPRDIGVISFYAAQTSVLTELLRGTGVKCGTVDAFQGTEREIIIVCCTNEYVSEFMQLPNRLNVAMSRAKQATIIVGNVGGMRNADYWRDIVQKVVENRNLVDVWPKTGCEKLPIIQTSYVYVVLDSHIQFQDRLLHHKYYYKEDEKVGELKKRVMDDFNVRFVETFVKLVNYQTNFRLQENRLIRHVTDPGTLIILDRLRRDGTYRGSPLYPDPADNQI
ncbi:hypothetical protein CAEBREN_15704 [Caenorhabditis brenneri]|uniref:C2H2-type domain-containing protein n=1 Tax=Caenorhabditis brenneri TaxID=135651 RepID=G0NW51_CAEBE|nr:hypothetical protein CAEBREN_15704 [Caenorhabditis brenneri]